MIFFGLRVLHVGMSGSYDRQTLCTQSFTASRVCFLESVEIFEVFFVFPLLYFSELLYSQTNVYVGSLGLEQLVY